MYRQMVHGRSRSTFRRHLPQWLGLCPQKRSFAQRHRHTPSHKAVKFPVDRTGGDKSEIWDAPYVMIGLGSASTVGDTEANLRLSRLAQRVEPEDQPLYDLRHHYSQQPAEAVEATLRPNQRVDQ